MTKTRIDANIVIVGNGESIKDGTVVFEDKKIVYVGESEHVPNDTDMTTIQAPVVMPGMWECHGHLLGLRELNVERSINTPPEVATLRGVWDVQEALKSGFTSLRELGGYGVYINRAIQEGFIQGPRIYGSRAILSMTGGHGDLHSLPLEVVRNSKSILRLVDGISDCYKGVREQLREGAEIIKYCGSGGVLSVIDHPIHQQLSDEEQRAIVEEATRAETAVASHVHGKPGIKSALEAGVTTIEHGSYLDEDLAQFMVEKNAILVPTRYIVEKIYEGAKKMGVPDYALQKLIEIYDSHLNAMKIAMKEGVTIAMGTDMGYSGPSGVMSWGKNVEELEMYVKAGMKPMDAIVTATGHGPLTLGKRAPRSGLLTEGYDSDILLLQKNPVDDITILQHRENFIQIIKQGKKVTL